MSVAPLIARPASVGGDAIRTAVPALVAIGELTRQSLKSGAREGQFVFAVGSPIVFFICFYVPLHSRFDRMGIDYAQNLVPLVVIQAAIFVSIISCEIAGRAAQSGVRGRLASLPMARSAPLISRMINASIRVTISLASTCALGAALGFRFHGSVWDLVGFVLLAVIFAVSLSLMADAAGSVADHPDSIAQMLMIPELILVVVSTGLVPVQSFPEWVHPFVRNNPVTIFVDAMRALAAGTDVDITSVVAWSVILIGLGLFASVLANRREVSR
ncbi:ABC transporter permease [Gordonia sp. NPDC003585]|uniref:ABC transporter permease n=1 Tax=unclassified Gordonia (in: high G+C Gram-positive bacteria) TaxID=2657482 RepID=UPI00339F2028